jgi:two-component system, NarL family, nitrate/nitrite response regulator NarL
MRDIFICPHGNLLANWSEACPKAMVSAFVRTVPVGEPVLFWLHANANSQTWLENTIAEISAKFSTSKIVVLANVPNQTEAMAAISKGAVGYCHAYTSAKVLAELKTVVLHGGIWLGPDLLQTLIGASRELVHNEPEQVHQALALLTPREKEVALQAATGLSNKEISRTLNITERTVKAHISSTLDRLGLKDRLQLALVLNEKTGETNQKSKQTGKAKRASKPVKLSQIKHTKPAKQTLSASKQAKKKLELAA